jgi:outer membrane protein OmpA-like peptidoglycan-associated protein
MVIKSAIRGLVSAWLCIALSLAQAEPARAQGSARALTRELITDEALLRQRFEGFSEGSDIVIVRDLQHLTLRIPARELFDADSAQLKPGIVSALPWSAVAQLLRKRHHIVAQINVYSDRIGLASANQGLTEQRSLVLLALLHAAGIRPERVAAAGLGASAPLAGDGTPEGREQNRRIEVVIGRK